MSELDEGIGGIGTLDESYKVFKAMSDEVDAIDTVTTILHVDGNRIDLYTEEGSRGYPFKTIQAAIDAASSPALIKIAPGSYNEQLTLKSGVSLWAKRNTVNITYDSGDVITRPDGVSSLWIYGLQVTVTGNAGKAAYKDLGTSGYIQIHHCYFGAQGATDFAIHAIAANNLWMWRTDCDGAVKLDTVVGNTLDKCQIVAVNQAGVPALHILNSTSVIYMHSTISHAHADAGSDALKIDGGSGHQIALGNCISTNQKACYVTGAASNITLAMTGFVGGAKDLDLDAGCSILFGSNMYNLANCDIDATITYIQPLDLRHNITQAAGTTTANPLDDIILAIPAGANMDIDLPAAASVPGKEYTITHYPGGTAHSVIVDPSGAETINGKADFELPNPYDMVKIKSVSAQWIVISSEPVRGQYTFIVDGVLAVADDQCPYLVVLQDCYLEEAYARVKTAPTGQALTIQIERSDDNEATWDEVVAPADFQIAAAAKFGSTTTMQLTKLNKNDILRFNIDQIGSVIAGADLSAFLRMIPMGA